MESPQRTKRRVALSAIVVVAFAGLFGLRLFDIQVVKAADYNAASTGKMSIPETVYGHRGDILDKNGKVLATQEMTYDVTVSPRNAKEFSRAGDRADIVVTPQEAAKEIGTLTGQTADEIITIINDALKENPDSDFAYIKKGVDVDTFKKLTQLNIPWLYFEQHPARVYPNGAVASNLVGYIGSDGEPLAGLELSEQSCVGQENGSQSYERGADGVRIPGSTVVSQGAKDGSTLTLTIDADLQWYAQQQLSTLAAEQNSPWALAVVMEAKTGKLLTVADYPTFDPNNIDAYPASDLGSRAFTAPYEPGSTMKVLSAAALVDSALGNPGSQVDAPYYIEFPNGASFHDSMEHPSNLTLEGVLTWSSNTGMAQLGALVPPEKRYDYLTKFGMGQPTAVNFPGESGGLLRTPDQWDNQSFYTMLFGQGMSATAIQMVDAYAAIANGGVRQPASLVESCTAPDGRVTTPQRADPVRVISQKSARTVVDMMENVFNQNWLIETIPVDGYRIAAKTGTAEHSDGEGNYSNKYNVSIVTVFPADNPQYVVLVTMSDPDRNQTGVIAQLTRSLTEQVIKTQHVAPSSGEPPFYPLYY